MIKLCDERFWGVAAPAAELVIGGIEKLPERREVFGNLFEPTGGRGNPCAPPPGTSKGGGTRRTPASRSAMRRCERLVRLGAVKERQGLPTTSPRPRHALAPDFAALFHPDLPDEPLQAQIARWQEANLSPGALARIALIRRGAVAREGRVLVTFPNDETRDMEPGPSSVISKAVVEEFAARFLEQPGVIWLSESRNQVVARDDGLAQAIGLAIDPGRNLPDLILVDLGPAEPLLIFVEVVATDGPVNEARQAAS